ncbi:Fungal-trans domain-containing protein [Mycena venus]|uniref:Fungal-trans domain-containing protein n=1 Tax=Mycena venus TaxID=2733690 RepID=A0A8H7CHL5_9AGAR|nr:Fungal-trans domain-containing protein [Mycena venus]
MVYYAKRTLHHKTVRLSSRYSSKYLAMPEPSKRSWIHIGNLKLLLPTGHQALLSRRSQTIKMLMILLRTLVSSSIFRNYQNTSGGSQWAQRTTDFLGKNSSIMFVKAAMEAHSKNSTSLSVTRTRPMYWTPLPWEACPEPVVTQVFPPADLLRDLVDIYFKEINIFSCILHRPSFQRSLADGLHLRDHEFGSVVLAVCALASKNSPDKRVLLPCEQRELSAGWEWFRQIRRPFSGRVVKTASVYEIQLCCLYLSFQQTGSDLESCWLLCGIGILQAQDIGAHRIKATPGVPLTVEEELLKRSCFYLSMFDSISSACFGRPRVAVPGECDLDRPTPCDDEYWEHPDPKQAFKQPPGKPSLTEYLNAYISLIKIFTFSWRTSGPPQDYTGTRPLEPETVAELDTRLNEWANKIPEHLLWNPYQEDSVFFEQSAALYASYYHVQILVHRPFIQAKSASTFKSLAICTNAARSCAIVADVKHRRGIPSSYHLVKAVFDSAIVLLLNISGGTRSGLAIDIDRELVDVYKCMRLLREMETRWQNAGRFYDCLSEVLNASNLPQPPSASLEMPSTKLSYDTSYERKPSAEINSGDRNTDSWPDDLLSLPMAVEDLGSLPIYGSLDSLGMNTLEKIADTDFGVLPEFNWSTPPPSTAMDTDTYLSHWIPYFSTVDGVAQAMQNVNGSS